VSAEGRVQAAPRSPNNVKMRELKFSEFDDETKTEYEVIVDVGARNAVKTIWIWRTWYPIWPYGNKVYRGIIVELGRKITITDYAARYSWNGTGVDYEYRYTFRARKRDMWISRADNIKERVEKNGVRDTINSMIGLLNMYVKPREIPLIDCGYNYCPGVAPDDIDDYDDYDDYYDDYDDYYDDYV